VRAPSSSPGVVSFAALAINFPTAFVREFRPQSATVKPSNDCDAHRPTRRDMLTEPTRDIDACPRAAVHRESAKK
jgi:hypothetical protein